MMLNRLLSSFALIAALTFLAPLSADAADSWLQVKSKNFFLIGNTSEKEIKRVATRLEQFREAFRNLFQQADLTGSVPTNVVVFKNSESYKPFKPKRGDGKADTGIAGYFQPGEDVNYITLSTEGDDKEIFGTIFHEYVHFILDTNFGKSEIPMWFNEGLAEYYQTFQIEEDIRVKLGLPQSNHLYLLQNSKLMPLDMLFNATHQQVHGTGGHSRSIFYSQSWALMHYLMQGGKGEALGNFVGRLQARQTPEKAFKEAFQMDYAAMERDLRKYIGQATYKYNTITFNNKLAFDTEMQVTPLDDAASNAYLGDLLFHSHRFDDAEPYLAKALTLEPASSMANTAMGMVKIRQRKWDEARNFLEKALSSDPRNHIAYYRHAYLLSREGQDEFGFSRGFSAETAAKMRASLNKAIEINPRFGESYEMLAFVSLVTGEGLDEAVAKLRTALKYQPGNQRYALRIAEIYARQNKFKEAEEIAAKIARTTDDDETRARAEGVLNQLGQRRHYEEQITAINKRNEEARTRRLPTGDGPPNLIRRVGDPVEINNRSINQLLRPLAVGEQRTLGKIQKIDCSKSPVSYTVGIDGTSFRLTSKDFDEIAISVFDATLATAMVGCDADLSAANAVITWLPNDVPKLAARGTDLPKGRLVALELVPAGFRIMTDADAAPIVDDVEAAAATQISQQPTVGSMPADPQNAMRQMMIDQMNERLRKPQAGEKRAFGFLEKIECGGKDRFMHFKTDTGNIKLFATQPPAIMLFTPDLAGAQFGCGMKPIEFPVVFVYTDKPGKSKTAGDVVSLDFVPKSFVLK